MASKDLGVAHTLARRFFWSENILWKDELGDRRVTVVLGGRDLIVDTETVGAYLSDADDESKAIGAWKDQKLTGSGLEVVFFPEIDHAQVFEKRGRMMEVVGIVEGYQQQGQHLVWLLVPPAKVSGTPGIIDRGIPGGKPLTLVG